MKYADLSEGDVTSTPPLPREQRSPALKKILRAVGLLLIAAPLLTIGFAVAALGLVCSLVGQCFLAGWGAGLEVRWPIRKVAK